MFSLYEAKMYKFDVDNPVDKLDDADIKIIEADSWKRQRWVDTMSELSQNCLSPASRIIRRKMHLHERFELFELDGTFGSTTGYGRPISSWVGSPSQLLILLDAYALEWRTLSKLWAAEDFSRLQPTAPGHTIIAHMALQHMGAKCAVQEQELRGFATEKAVLPAFLTQVGDDST